MSKKLSLKEVLEYLDKGFTLEVSVPNSVPYYIHKKSNRYYYQVTPHNTCYELETLLLNANYEIWQDKQDFIWAIHQLKAGEKVVRCNTGVFEPIWQETMSGFIVERTVRGQQKWCPTIDDLQAKDWVEYIP